MSVIHTIPIKELYKLTSITPTAAERNVKCERFIIPDYQRGFRWEAKIQVEALLNDIRDFMKLSKNSKDCYCLQPIVVSESPTSPGAWEVIDGQQRLTTLYFLLKALNLPTFILEFETRTQCTNFIDNLISNNQIDYTHPDFYFMSEAWTTINKWLDEMYDADYGFKLQYSTTLVNNVNVIWYDIQSHDREKNIDVFNRLNIGKIPLTDAELVKALLLSKIKGIYEGEELTLRQSEISNEWHAIEIELQKPQKWNFLTGSTSKVYESHIELIFDLMAKKKDEANYSTYLWFEYKIKMAGEDPMKQAETAIELWNEIKVAFARINSWFCDATPDTAPTIYHYVGYLLASDRIKLQKLFEDSQFLSKKAFIHYLYDKVLESISGIDLDDITYEQNPKEIKRLLLLFNVLSCEKIANGIYNRFPFDRYNMIDKEKKGKGGWSLEHIYAQNSQNPIKGFKAIRNWLKDTIDSLKDIDFVNVAVSSEDDSQETENSTIELGGLKDELMSMYCLKEKELNEDEFNDLKERVNNLFGELPKHVLSNMALLSTDDNAALNNSIFPVKRTKIIRLEKEGKFIPPCTRNVFLKFYSESDSQPYYWGAKDQAAYLNEIKQVINNFKNNHGC